MGALTLRLLIGDLAPFGTTIPSGSIGQSFGLESLLSAVLMFVSISVATDTKAVGFTVALDALWGGLISGASMNPARSLGPALIGGVPDNQWIYLVAPVIGMVPTHP